MKKKKTIIAAVILLLLFIVGGAIAYFTDKDTATNKFTIGKVDIAVEEKNWVTTDADANGIPDAAQDLMPGETVAKDPKINNLSTTNKAYVFAKVVIPCSTGENSTPVKPLFTYTSNSGWYLMTPDNQCNAGSLTRIYAYGTSTEMTELEAKDDTKTTDETTTIFDSVTLNPQLDGTEKDLTTAKEIVITGYGVQSEGLGTKIPSEVWSAASFS